MLPGRDDDEAGASPAATSAPTIGRGRYALVAKIAEGGMAGVYRAWDTKLHIWRAVKILLPEFSQRRSLRQRFETEASTMAALDHPNIIRVYDVVTDEALPYMVMELAEGGSLIGWLESYGPMPPRLACSVVIESARGLSAAHAAGVVHRDVKPHNVLVSVEGQCKVTDFGIARVAKLEGMTRTGSTMGTIGYMAPEQRADAKWVDARADIYSLGALLYKLVTGVIVSDLFLVEHEPDLLKNVPEPLHEVVLRACFHARDRRFPDTAALVATLEAIRDLLPPDQPDTPPLPIVLDDVTLDRASGEPPFSEIAVLLGTPLPGGDVPSRERAVLPYRMPERRKRRFRSEDPTEPPSYVEQPALPDTKPHPSLGPAALQPPPNVAARPEPEPPTEAVSAPEPSNRSVRALATAAVVAWILLALLAAGGAWNISNHAQNTRLARSQLYEQIQQEQGIVQDLRRAGGDDARLTRVYDLYLAFQAARDEAIRSSTAAAFVQALEAETRAVLGVAAVEGERNLTRDRVDHVVELLREAQTAHAEWSRAASSPAGRLATGFGIVASP